MPIWSTPECHWARPVFGPDRSVGAYFRAIRDRPGFGARVMAAGSFSLAVVASEGVIDALMLLAVVLVASVLIGYPIWRRRGRR